MRLFAFVLMLACVSHLSSAEIKIEIAEISPTGESGAVTNISPAQARDGEVRFGSVGGATGSTIINRTGSTVTGLIITLTSAGDTFDPSSTGGTVFPDVVLSADKKIIVFKGGSVANLATFWIKIPRSSDLSGGVGRYTGRAIVNPPLPPPPPRPQTQPVKNNLQRSIAPVSDGILAVGKSNSAGITYSSGTLSFSVHGLDFTHYLDGTEVHANSAAETILGTDMVVSNVTLKSNASTDGSFMLNDALIGVQFGDFQTQNIQNFYIVGGLTDAVVYPDSSVPGYDSVIIATIVGDSSSLGLTSRFLSEYHSDISAGVSTLFVFRSSILGATNGFTQSSSSIGKASIEVQRDREGPKVLVPPDTTLSGPSTGLAVQYDVVVYDNQDLNPSVVCTPPSGSNFPVGTTTVTCLGKDRNGNETQAQFNITIVAGSGAGSPGTGPQEDFDGDGIVNSLDADDDNDGVSDLSEIQLGTDPFNSLSIKKSTATTAKVTGTLNFTKTMHDSIAVTAVMQGVPANINPIGAPFSINVGGVRADFVLDKNAKAKNDNGTVQVKLKKVRDSKTKTTSFAGGAVAVNVKLLKGTWSDELANDGINPSITVKNQTISLPVELLFNGVAYTFLADVEYSGTSGKSGRFK